MLLKLVSNSFKFTFAGGSIKISLTVIRVDFKKYVKFEVKDTGIGIKDEDQPKLFRLFGMLPQNPGINPNGCGIGLTVSKKLIEALEGKITLKSKYNVGTTVTFTVPLDNKRNSDLLHQMRRECNMVDQFEVEQERMPTQIYTVMHPHLKSMSDSRLL